MQPILLTAQYSTTCLASRHRAPRGFVHGSSCSSSSPWPSQLHWQPRRRPGVTCNSSSTTSSSSSSSNTGIDSSSNLGQLSSYAQQDSSASLEWTPRVPVSSFEGRGVYMDSPALFGSGLLLIVLLALSFERILGLDRVINKALRTWQESRQYQRRNDAIKAREGLEQQWDPKDKDADLDSPQ